MASSAWTFPELPWLNYIQFPRARRPCFRLILNPERPTVGYPVRPKLFAAGELVCTGPNSETAIVRPLEECLGDAQLQQFIVANPMRARDSRNYDGHPSSRCQNNVQRRRYIVTEFDDPRLTKPQQAKLVTRLATFLPLILVVDSGGKSLHATLEYFPPPATQVHPAIRIPDFQPASQSCTPYGSQLRTEE